MRLISGLARIFNQILIENLVIIHFTAMTIIVNIFAINAINVIIIEV
jgi:hypothetical protein